MQKMGTDEDLNETLRKGGIYNQVSRCYILKDVVKVNYRTDEKVSFGSFKNKRGKSFCDFSSFQVKVNLCIFQV